MAFKEPKMNKASIQMMYDVLGTPPERPKKGKKPSTVKRSGNKATKKK